TASGLGYELHGLGGGSAGQANDNDTVRIFTASGYSRIDISGIGNDTNKDTFDILLSSVAVPTPFNITFQTQANLTDKDGDTTTASTLNVTLLKGALTAASLGDGAGAGALTEQGLQRGLAAALAHWAAAAV